MRRPPSVGRWTIPHADARTRGRALTNLAIGLNDAQRYEEALDAYDRSIEALAGCDDAYGARIGRANRALLYCDLGRNEDSVRELDGLVQECVDAGDVHRAARILNAIASIVLEASDVEKARGCLARATEILGADGSADHYENAYLNASSLAAAYGDDETMAVFYGAHQRIHDDLGSSYNPRVAVIVQRCRDSIARGGEALEARRADGYGASSAELHDLMRRLLKP